MGKTKPKEMKEEEPARIKKAKAKEREQEKAEMVRKAKARTKEREEETPARAKTKEREQEKKQEETKTKGDQRKVWMSQLITSFGVLIFRWSKFWRNVLRRRSKIEKDDI